MQQLVRRELVVAIQHQLLDECCFFFSSRRRHTRWPRDWSSDVCSSDLGPHRRIGDRNVHATVESAVHRRAGPAPSRAVRSEERRVGKVEMPGVGASLEKKKKMWYSTKAALQCKLGTLLARATGTQGSSC